ncbi:hypothetical protein OROHE_003586 [Orobanche hederae]
MDYMLIVIDSGSVYKPGYFTISAYTLICSQKDTKYHPTHQELDSGLQYCASVVASSLPLVALACFHCTDFHTPH